MGHKAEIVGKFKPLLQNVGLQLEAMLDVNNDGRFQKA
jgi:hypothetical protein